MDTLELFHHPLSVCSMKVRLALEEKGLAWSGRAIDIVHTQEQLEPWYLEINPRGVIPTLQYHNGTTRVVTDSARIIRFIAELSQGNRLLPETESDRVLMNDFIDRADEIDLQVLSYARHPSMENSGKILEARVEKSQRLAKEYPELKDSYQLCAERSKKSMSFRVDEEHVEEIESGAQVSLSVLEEQLAGRTYLLGDTYTLADVIWTVVLSRLDLLEYTNWVAGTRFPSVVGYYQRMKNRSSYSLAQVQNQWWKE